MVQICAECLWTQLGRLQTHARFADNKTVVRPDDTGASEGTRKVSWDAVRRQAGDQGRRMIHLATKCLSEEDFIRRFSPFTSESSIALPSGTDLSVGDRGRFLITLKNRSPVMRGKCEVIGCLRHWLLVDYRQASEIIVETL